MQLKTRRLNCFCLLSVLKKVDGSTHESGCGTKPAAQADAPNDARMFAAAKAKSH